jgi:hypothetical protein
MSYKPNRRRLAPRTNAPVETGVAAARAGYIGNLAYHHGGQVIWPLSPAR